MKPSIKEVARLAGVSVATVSHVLNGTKNVLPETRRRVLDAVEKLDYTINPLARNFRRGESRLIGFVVSDLSNTFFQELSMGMESRLAEDGYRPVLMDSKESKTIEIENVRNLLTGAVDGLVIAPTTEDCSYLSLLLRHTGLPVVFVDRQPQGFDGDTVLSTNCEGAYGATEHLIAKGYRDIGFVGCRTDSTMIERVEGYRKALAEAGIAVREDYIMTDRKPTESNRKDRRHGYAYNATGILLQRGVRALLAGSNQTSVEAFAYLRERGLRVPEDLAFITFDDSFWLTMTTPGLTAMAQDPERIGSVAATMLLERIQSPDRESRTIRIPTQLQERDSC